MEQEGFRGRADRLRRALAGTLGRLPPRTRRGLAVAGLAAAALAVLIYQAAGRPPENGSAPAGQEDGTEAARPEPRIIVVDPADAQAAGSEGAAGGGESAEPVLSPPESLVWPVSGPVTTVHGWGRDATMDDWRFHNGIDVSAPAGQPVLAAADGRVTAVYLDDAWGWVVEIQHAPGYVSRYANLDRPGVAQGVEVRAGDPIGTVGASAPVKAGQPPHLHFELQWDGEAVDPLTVLPQGS